MHRPTFFCMTHSLRAATAALLLFTLPACVAGELTGPLGGGAPNDSYTNRGVASPVRVAGTTRFAQVSAGFFHTCAVDGEGAAWCWGSNQFLQLGTADTTTRCELLACKRVPVRVSSTLTFRSVAAGYTHSCGITTDQRVACWGSTYSSTEFLLGTAATARSAVPVPIDSNLQFTQVGLGWSHSCALSTAGLVYCWGLGVNGLLGTGTRVPSPAPVPVATALRFVQIAVGGAHSCALTASGEAWCWGFNRWGPLGYGDVPPNSYDLGVDRPTRVAGTQQWRAIAAGTDHSCALDDRGRAWCWGLNSALQLGHGRLDSHSGVPVAVQEDRAFSQIIAGSVNSCGRMTSGEVWCWGSNYFGALGNGRQVNGGEPRPVQLRGGPYASITQGGSHACGIDTSGVTWCWGDQLFGQVGWR